MPTISSFLSSYLSHCQTSLFVNGCCQLSNVISSSSNHPLFPTPHNRLISSGWNSSSALSRRSDIISSRSLFRPFSLSLLLVLLSHLFLFSFIVFSISRLSWTSFLLALAHWWIAREAPREVPVPDFLYFFFWTAAERGEGACPDGD